MKKIELINNLKRKNLRITPQRLAIYEAICALKNHPTADNIIEFIKEHHPNIATGTVYKVLDTLVEKKIIKKVKTEKDIMRYDGFIENHHHLYCIKSDLIKDFVDEDLDKLLKEYFKKKKFPNFEIEDIVLQIKGTFGKQ